MTIGRLSKTTQLERIGNNYTLGFSIVGDQGSVATSGDFKIHTYTSSAPASTKFSTKAYTRSNVISSTVGVTTVEYLVVAGGGGGAYGGGGGGGGGGLLSNHYSVPAPLRGTALDFATAPSINGPLTITIGSGGGENGTGGPSVFGSPLSTISATGGGSNSGGGGSGSGANWPGPSSGGPAVSGQGNVGGGPARNANYGNLDNNSAGGGGGAGGAGNNGISGGSNPGSGGAHLDVTITGSPYAYSAGGGGGGGRSYVFNYGRPHDSPIPYPGGRGGSGGNGAGQGAATHPTVARDATAATSYGGGGGGGAQQGSGPFGGTSRSGQPGGQGVVIVKYKYQ